MRNSSLLRKPKIGQTRIPIPVKNNIPRFQVSINNLRLMQGLKRKRNLRSILPHQVLLQRTLSLDHLQHIASRTVVHHQVKLSFGLECVVQFNHVRVVDC